MQRTPVNPWPWSLERGYSQAELVENVTRRLVCSGQTATDGEGRPLHADDMRAQMELALDNLDAVLAAAGMGAGDVVKLGIFATDVDAALANFDLVGRRFGARPPAMTLLGVDRLALPELTFEVEAEAVT